MRKIILIGGAPTTGKSTLAKELSKHFDLPWISSDQIRKIMSATVKEEDYKNIFNTKGFNAKSFYKKYSTKEISDMEFKQGKEVWKGVKAFIDHDWVWRDGFILEGLNVLPNLINKDYKNDATVKSVFLVDKNDERIRKVVFERGLWDDSEKYPDYIKEKEIEWVKSFNDKIKSEAEKYNMPCIEVEDHKKVFQNVLKVLNIKNAKK